jgi:ABC transporter substrate-binding protein PnrA-like/Caspase domain
MNDRPPLRDYSRSLAVLMGTWDYEFLDRVGAAEHSLRRMAGLLTGPLCGWPQDRLLLVENEPSPGNLADRLITAFDGISDVALFYFVGHGQISPDDQLCLGLTQSRPEPNRRVATSLRFSDVRQALQDSEAAVKIVVLDCCFAGLATTRTGALAGRAGERLLDLTAGTGAYTMAATSAYATAWYQDEPGLAEPQTYFTKYLADLVETGIPGQPSRLQLDALFKQLRDNLATDQRPVPRSRAVNDARDFAFAYNAAPPATHRDPEKEVANLSQQLAETERELAHLRRLLASPESRDAGQQRELRDAVEEVARQVDEVRAARAASTAGGQAGFAGTDVLAPGPAELDAEEARVAVSSPGEAGADDPAAQAEPKEPEVHATADEADPGERERQPADLVGTSGGGPDVPATTDSGRPGETPVTSEGQPPPLAHRARPALLALSAAIIVAVAVTVAVAVLTNSPSSSSAGSHQPLSSPASYHPSSSHQPASSPITSTASGKIVGCMVTNTGGLNDHSINASAWVGMEEAANANSDVTAKYLISVTPSDFVPNIDTFISLRCSIIVTVGSAMAFATEVAAKANPSQKFAIVGYNYTPSLPNVRGLPAGAVGISAEVKTAVLSA